MRFFTIQVIVVFLFILNVQGYSLGFIVGEVLEHDARIVYWQYESLNETEKQQEVFCSISMYPPSSSAAFSIISPESSPKVLELTRLNADQQYLIHFHCGRNSAEEEHSTKEFIQFKTLPKIPKPMNMFFHSCNRLSEQEDFVMWEKLRESASDKMNTLHVHLGDQIYADKVSKLNRDHCITYLDVLKEYRKIYTQSWDYPVLANILRNHSHLMFLDDHDIVNNFNKEKWKDTDPWNKALARAGIQTFLEYQYQLFNPIPSFSFVEFSEEAKCCLPYINGSNICTSEIWDKFDKLVSSIDLWGKRVYGSIGLLWLDTRNERSLGDEGVLFGDKQLNFVEETLKEWNSDENIKTIIVASGVPIIYQSSFMSQIAYIAEKERYPTHPDLIESTGKLLDILFEYPSKLQLISGDIHMHLESEICRLNDNICISQLVTSGMTTKSSTLRSLHLYLYSFFAVQFFTPYVSSEKATYYLQNHNVFLDNNYIKFYFDLDFNHWEVFLRELPELKLQILQKLFATPHVYSFFIYSIAGNLAFIILSIVYVCCFRRFIPKTNIKEKKE